jgi:predicted nucleic acid-binding protein
LSELLLDASVWLAALDPDDRYHAESARLVDPASAAAGGEKTDERGDGGEDKDRDEASELTGGAQKSKPVDAIEPRALAALDLTFYEVANVAVVYWRSRADAQRVIQLIGLACSVVMTVDGQLLDDAVDIAEKHGLTVYDAAYVASARRQSQTLVSCDLKDLVRPGFAVAPDAVAR